MKVIALKGDSNSGKTTTLNKLILELIQMNAKLKWAYNSKTEEDVVKAIQEMFSSGSKRDRNIILCYNGLHIAITTLGDTENMIKNAYELLLRHSTFPIDVFVCASRPQGDKVLPICYKITDKTIITEYITEKVKSVLNTDEFTISPKSGQLFIVNKEKHKELPYDDDIMVKDIIDKINNTNGKMCQKNKRR